MKNRQARAVGLLLLFAGVWQGCAERDNPTISKSGSSSRNEQASTKNLAPRRPQQGDWFGDVTPQAGVNSTYHSGRDAGFFTILETVGGGVAVFDYDQDGEMDLFFPGGGKIATDPPAVSGRPSKLYRNEGNGKFRDVTRQAGLDRPGDYSHGCAVNDFNRDGWPDLFVTCYGQSRLYQNENGERFSDVTEAVGLNIPLLEHGGGLGGRESRRLAGFVRGELSGLAARSAGILRRSQPENPRCLSTAKIPLGAGPFVFQSQREPL